MKKYYQLIQKGFLIDGLSELFNKKSQLTRELPIITISREKGSGGRPIAHLITKKLGKPWKIFHEEIVNQIAKEENLEKKLVKELDENKIPLVEEFIADFFGKRYLNLATYYRDLVKILSTIGQRGHAIIIGRGADYLIPNALKVRVICEMAQRVQWMMEYEKLSKKEAVQRIEDSDQKRINFIKTLYQHDLRKAHHYDLIIRTGPNFSIENAANLIVFAAKKRFNL
jgi:cytidylate kinase